MISTKNFNPKYDKKLLCTCGHKDCDQRSVDQNTLDMAQLVREGLNYGLTVTSGGRCPNHPDEVHRTTPADHQKGKGLDIAVSGATRGNTVRMGLRFGFNAIGIAKTFVHLGHRPDLPEGHVTMWTY